jgi:hypothetical protein
MYDKGAPTKNLNKGYEKESVKTERSNLMNDNPVAKDASGGRPMILKHMSGSMGSSPVKMHHENSPAKMLKGDQVKLDANKNGKIDGEDFKILRK